MPDITLVNPPIGLDVGNHPLPYGLWQLASFVKQRGFTPSILDLNFLWRERSLDYSGLKAQVLNIDAPVVGFTCMGNNCPTALELAADLKANRPDVTVVFGGPHASLIGEPLLRHFACIDYVVVGEGECTLSDMLAGDIGHWTSIPGVLSRSAPLIRRPLMPSFDHLPPLDLRLVNWETYRVPMVQDHFAFPLLAGSGCPFACIFCSTSVMWERRFRVKSPDRLANEMQSLAAETGCRRFDLVHDIFTANKRYIGEFCRAITGHDLAWLCSSRIDGLNPDEIADMAEAGCTGIFFGVESASPTIQQTIGKRLKVERILPTLEACVRSGTDCVCSTIFGFPEETWHDISATAQLCIAARQLGVGRANMHLLMALPGTSIYRRAPLAVRIEERDLQRAGLPIITQRATDWIDRHPDIFSAFRWVEHPTISKDEMFGVLRWGRHLATHPESLDNILRCHDGQLRDSVHTLMQVPQTDSSTAHALEHVAQLPTCIGLPAVFREEERRAAILAVYQRTNRISQRRFAYWIGRSEASQLLLYEVAADAVTIHIYELTEQESEAWEAVSDTQLLTPGDLARLGSCWPVVGPDQADGRSYAIH